MCRTDLHVVDGELPKPKLPIVPGHEIVGEVTSGTKSPTLDRAIGLALVDPGVDDWFEILIRDNPVPAKAVPLPFYKRNRG